MSQKEATITISYDEQVVLSLALEFYKHFLEADIEFNAQKLETIAHLQEKIIQAE